MTMAHGDTMNIIKTQQILITKTIQDACTHGENYA